MGDYTLIYGNINPRAFNVGTEVEPDTLIGTIPTESDGKIHLEIRYQGNKFVNPMLFFTQVHQAQIIETFPPEGDDGFYSSPTWQEWLSPFDQPTITISGSSVIGPTASE